MARRKYFSSNHKDAPNDVILTESRIHKLSSFKREKRKYSKKMMNTGNMVSANTIITEDIHVLICIDIYEQRQPV